MSKANPKLVRQNSYEHVVFHTWQIRLLMTSSLSFLVASSMAASLKQHKLCGFLLVAGLCSLSYWRAPGASWRRDADLAAAGAALFYCLYVGFWLNGLVCQLSWLGLLSGLACFRRSWNLSLGHCDVWAIWHATAHALSAGAAIALAHGDVAHVGGGIVPPRNTIAECSVAAIVLTVVVDVCRVYSHEAPGGPQKAKAP